MIRTVSTPLPTNSSRMVIEKFAQSVTDQFCVDYSNISGYAKLAKDLKFAVRPTGRGGCDTYSLRMICWTNKDIEVWPNSYLGMLSGRRENVELLILIAHYLLHLPMVHKKYGNDSIMHVPSILHDDENDVELKRARIEAVWFALYLAYPHAKILADCERMGIDDAKYFCYVTNSWFDMALDRANKLNWPRTRGELLPP